MTKTIVADQLYCPCCGQHLKTLASLSHSWANPGLELDCPCGVRLVANHINNDARCGLQVAALVIKRGVRYG